MLTLVAYATTREHRRARPDAARPTAIPIGFAVVLIGFFVLVTRRKAVTQIVGFLLLDNGIALVAFLATAGRAARRRARRRRSTSCSPCSILQVLTTRMRAKFGAIDLDQLRGAARLMLSSPYSSRFSRSCAAAAVAVAGWRTVDGVGAVRSPRRP